ncbi:hypothetical protein [Streptomyces subrutilus]|uniref:hypothetical protein n=1 Tax=Streptomyces subrutilus TaxID=36818 RepID=UPI0033F39A0C
MSQTEHEPPAQERAREERPREEGAREERPREEGARQPAHRSDPRELLIDGVVELRKRGELPLRRAGEGDEDHLEAMARLAAQRVAAEARPCA